MALPCKLHCGWPRASSDSMKGSPTSAGCDAARPSSGYPMTNGRVSRCIGIWSPRISIGRWMTMMPNPSPAPFLIPSLAGCTPIGSPRPLSTTRVGLGAFLGALSQQDRNACSAFRKEGASWPSCCRANKHGVGLILIAPAIAVGRRVKWLLLVQANRGQNDEYEAPSSLFAVEKRE